VRRDEFSRRLKVTLVPIDVTALHTLIQERVDRKVASLLGLARRARKVVSGAEAVESAVRKQRARLILTAADASEGSVATIRALAARSGVTCRTHLAMEELGAAVGATPRSCVAVTDPQLAEAVKSVLAKIPSETEAGECSRVEPIDGAGRANSRMVWR
jgi:ribosomal protein L7Ae-like RNA K-turn-binding protein